MFLPGRNVQNELQEKQRHYRRIEDMAMQLIPDPIQNDCTISVQEVQCGDPQCAPIDTMITIFFTSGGQGMIGLPMEAREVTAEELENVFPPTEILQKWYDGEEAEWPPSNEQPLELRFGLGTEVLCRVGPTPNDWSPGRIIQQLYREPGWPEGVFAPYKVKLNDGRDIFAPADMDQVIRLNPNAARPNGLPNPNGQSFTAAS